MTYMVLFRPSLSLCALGDLCASAVKPYCLLTDTRQRTVLPKQDFHNGDIIAHRARLPLTTRSDHEPIQDRLM